MTSYPIIPNRPVPLDPDDVAAVWAKHSQALLADDGRLAQALGLIDYDAAPPSNPIHRGAAKSKVRSRYEGRRT